MRRKSLLYLIFGLLLFAGLGISQAQTQITLMDYNQQWRYLITDTFPAGWSASNFNATAWSQGNGVLGFPAGEAMPGGVPAITTVLATNYNSTFVTSFYFRASITLTSNPNSLSITGLCVVDDGAVIYINGREITPRLAMPTGAILPTTFSTRQDDVGGATGHGVDTFAINSTNFVQGLNQIAVEVHQGGFNSSDIVFGMSLVGTVLSPPTIVTQPQSQTVEAGRSATFSVVANGSAPLTYRWYSNGVQLAASSASYTTPLTTLAMNGTVYYVTVSNRFGLTQSSNAVLTVELDDNGPKLILATPTAISNQLEATFDEQVTAATATNKSNYGIFILGTTDSIAVTNVQFGQNKVRLSLDENIDVSSNYVVCAYNIQDIKTNRTNITPVSCIGVSFNIVTNIIPFSSSGWWYEPGFPNDNCLSTTNWMATNYNEADPNFSWQPNGLATFYYSQNDWGAQIPCAPLDGTQFFLGPRKFYFRKRFSLNTTFGTNVTLQLRHFVDDGAVFYVNGVEVGRYNMPPAPTIITCNTPPSSAILNPNCQVISLPINGNALLNLGTNNVLAAELHEAAEFANPADDYVFDAELSFVYRRTPTVPVLTITRTAGNPPGVVLTWTGETNTWRVQRALSITGPWTNMVTSPTQNRYQETRGQGTGQRFYRLANP